MADYKKKYYKYKLKYTMAKANYNMLQLGGKKAEYNVDVGKYVKVYNGKSFIELALEERMIGHTLGAFVLTKKIGENIHKKKEKGKKKK